MIWYETLTCRYFRATKKEVKKLATPEINLGEVLDFLENHNLPRVGYIATLDPTIKVSISIVDKKLIITI